MLYVCTHVCLSVCPSVCLSVSLRVYVHTSIHTCIYVIVYVDKSVYVCNVYICVSTCIYTYVTYMYTHILGNAKMYTHTRCFRAQGHFMGTFEVQAGVCEMPYDYRSMIHDAQHLNVQALTCWRLGGMYSLRAFATRWGDCVG